MNYNFLVNRLMRMSSGEIVHRLKEKKKIIKDKEYTAEKKLKYNILDMDYGIKLNRNINLWNKAFIVRDAENVCAGKIDLFSMKDIDISKGINYHKDYKSLKCSPQKSYFKSIDYRDGELMGDIKYIWEINRHLFLLKLVLAYNLTNNKKYISKIKYYINEWIKQNPFLYGVNWSSSLELGIRLINWSLCYSFIKNEIDDEFKGIWVDSVYKHIWLINRYYSKYSSANNHLIGEAAGVFIASSIFPKYEETSVWLETAKKILEEECIKQNYEDGVNKEQAISYQQFVLDFLIIAGFIGKISKSDFSKEYWAMIEKMIEFLVAIEDCCSNFPQFGDEDDGLVIDIGQNQYGIYRSIINTGAFLFERKEFYKTDYIKDNKTSFLLSIINMNEYILPKRTRSLPAYFKEGGYYILGDDFNMFNEQKMIFDCGSLGYLSLSAHGHADALSFYFSAGGVPIFVDPGTYAYHVNKKWRDYFRGTRAHNTLNVNNSDQSIMSGNFMWSKKAKADIISYTYLQNAKGFHDGYLRLKNPLYHTREIIYYKKNKKWEIVDDISSKGCNNLEFCYHLHPDCKVVKHSNGTIIIEFKMGKCILDFDKTAEIVVDKGNINECIGWYSKSYDYKEPCHTIMVRKRNCTGIKMKTSFKIIFK
ncbi:MAG: alginate lyase family protein [Clostridiales bacterium]